MCKVSSLFKWIFFALNVIILLIGLVCFALISLIADKCSTGTLIGFIVLNFLFLFISILGCWGTYKEDALLMKASVISLLVLFIYGLVYKFAIVSSTDANKTLVEQKWAEEIKYPDSMAMVQFTFRCCGKDSPDDYETVLHRPIPITCYSLASELYKRGCLSAAEAQASKIEGLLFPYQLYVLTILMFAIACYLIWYFTEHQLDNDP